jgi:hypothetical protein
MQGRAQGRSAPDTDGAGSNGQIAATGSQRWMSRQFSNIIITGGREA